MQMYNFIANLHILYCQFYLALLTIYINVIDNPYNMVIKEAGVDDAGLFIYRSSNP